VSSNQEQDPAGIAGEYLHERLGWLVALRWAAIVGLVLSCGLATWLRFLGSWPEILLIIVAMTLYNALFTWGQRWWGQLSAAGVRRVILVQLLLDGVALSALLHYSDSVENPCAMFLTLPVAVGVMMLPMRHSVLLTAMTALTYASVVVAEYLGVVDHHPFLVHHKSSQAAVPDAMFQSVWMVLGYLGVFTFTLSGIAYIVGTVAAWHRRAVRLSQERERLARSRERMARVGQIAAGVAHSVRNPLHGLFNGLDIVSARIQSDADAEATVALMDEGLRRIDMVTRRLLVLTRDVPIAPRPTDLDDLVRDTQALVLPRTGERRVPVSLALGGVGVAEVDPDRIGEVVANLLSNAIDACDGDGAVAITTSDAGGGRVSIEVSDTGTGIAND